MIMDKETTEKGIFRTDSGALINKDNNALLSYKMKKQQSKKVSNLEEKIDKLEYDIDEIKNLLLKLIQSK